MEICPNRIRGGMIVFQAAWYVYLFSPTAFGIQLSGRDLTSRV